MRTTDGNSVPGTTVTRPDALNQERGFALTEVEAKSLN